MPLKFCVIEPLDLYYARWSGDILPNEILENFDRYRNHPKFKVGRPEIVDLRKVTDLKFGTQFISTLVSKFRVQRVPQSGVTKMTILADSALSYGRARQFQALSLQDDRMDVHILRDEFEALQEQGHAPDGLKSLLERHDPEWVPGNALQGVE